MSSSLTDNPNTWNNLLISTCAIAKERVKGMSSAKRIMSNVMIVYEKGNLTTKM